MEETEGKRVGWAELFFDLVFVIAVTRVSALLEGDHSVAGLLRALVVFVPVYWLWVGTAVVTDRQDADRNGVRLRVFAVALAAVGMAVALPLAYDDLGLLFAGSCWAGRLVLGVPVVRRGAGVGRLVASPLSVGAVLTAPLLVVGALLAPGPRETVWALAALVDLASLTLLRHRLRDVRYDAGHMTERFGLFVLIALGESLVSVSTSADPTGLTLGQGVAIALAFVVVCGLWWVYFAFAADAMRHAMATARVQTDIQRLVLAYGHLLFLSGVILVAVGLHEAIDAPGHHLGWSATLILYGGCVLYLAGFGFTRWAMFRQVSWTRLSAAAAVAVLAPVATLVPALLSLLLLAVVLAGLNVLEWALVNGRIGRGRGGRPSPPAAEVELAE